MPEKPIAGPDATVCVDREYLVVDIEGTVYIMDPEQARSIGRRLDKAADVAESVRDSERAEPEGENAQ